MTEVTHADFFSFLGLIAKVIISLIGLRLLIMVFGIHMYVPILDPAITMIRHFLVSMGLPGVGF